MASTNPFAPENLEGPVLGQSVASASANPFSPENLSDAPVATASRSAIGEIAAGVRRFGPSLKQTIAATSAGAQEAAGKPVDATTQAALDQSKADLAANAPEPADQHNWLVRAVAGAPQAIASFLPMAGAQAGGELAGPLGGAAAVGAQQYAQRYHEALEEANAPDANVKLTPDQATAYAQKEAELSGALGAGFGLLPVGGPIGRGIAKAVGLGAAKTAAEVGTEAVAKKAFLPTLATKALEGQAGLSAYSAAQAVGSNVNKQEAGLPSTSAGDAALEGLQGSLEGGLAFAPFWALHARGDVKRTAFAQDGLDNVQTAQPKRLAAANQVYAAMAKADKPAADVWRKNAAVAIVGGKPVGLTPDWFTGEPDYLKPPEPKGVGEIDTGAQSPAAATPAPAVESPPAAWQPPASVSEAAPPYSVEQTPDGFGVVSPDGSIRAVVESAERAQRIADKFNAEAPPPTPQAESSAIEGQSTRLPDEGEAAAVTPENAAKAAQLDQTAAAAGTQDMPFSQVAKAAALDGTTDAVRAKTVPPAPEPEIPPEVTEAQDSADDIAKRNRKEAIKASDDALKFDKDNPPDGGFIAKVPDNVDTLQGMADETQTHADALRQSDAPRTALLDAEVANFKKRQDALRATLPEGDENAKTRNIDELSKGEQALPRGGGEAGGDAEAAIRERGNSAVAEGAQTIGGAGATARDNAARESARQPSPVEAKERPDLLGNNDRNGLSLRAQGSDGEEAGASTSPVGARSPQGRERPEQQPGQPPVDESVGARQGAQSPAKAGVVAENAGSGSTQTGPVVAQVPGVRDLQPNGPPVRGAGAVQDLQHAKNQDDATKLLKGAPNAISEQVPGQGALGQEPEGGAGVRGRNAELPSIAGKGQVETQGTEEAGNSNAVAATAILTPRKLFGSAANHEAVAEQGFAALDADTQHAVIADVRNALSDPDTLKAAIAAAPDEAKAVAGDPTKIADSLTVSRTGPTPVAKAAFIDKLAEAAKPADKVETKPAQEETKSAETKTPVAEAPAPKAETPPPDPLGWEAATAANRKAIAVKAGIGDALAEKVAAKGWGELPGQTRDILTRGGAEVAAKPAAAQVERPKAYPQWAHTLDLRDGDTVTLSKRIDYAGEGEPYRIDIDAGKGGELWVQDMSTGGRTSLRPSQVAQAIKDGTMTVDRAHRADTLGWDGATKARRESLMAKAGFALKDGSVSAVGKKIAAQQKWADMTAGTRDAIKTANPAAIPKRPPEQQHLGQQNNVQLKRLFHQSGVDIAEQSDISGERGAGARRGGQMPGTFRNNGMKLDDWGEKLVQQGWLEPESQSERGNENIRASMQDVREFMRRVFDGEPVWKLDQMDERAKWAEEQGDRLHGLLRPEELLDLADESHSAAENAMEFDAAKVLEASGIHEADLDSIVEAASIKGGDDAKAYEQAIHDEIEKVRQRDAESGKGAPVKEKRPSLELASETNEQVLAREKATADAEAKTKADKATADSKERDERVKAEVKQRSEAAAGTFELGQKAEDNLSGQRDLLTGAKPEAKDQTKPAPANTEDAGAELAYNRRNRIRGGITWSDIADKNPTLQVKETNKQNVYPKPDYEALVKEVQHPTIAHIVKQIYDAIAAKPQTRAAPTAEDMQRYIAGVHRVMDGVMKWARDADQTKAFLGGIGERAGKLLGASRGEPTSVTSMIDRGGRPLVDAIYPDGWKAHADEIRAIGGNKFFRALQPGTDEVIRGMKAVEEGWPASQEAWQKRFFLDEKDGKFHVMMKAAKWRHAAGDPPDGFASKEAAEDFARSLTKRENKPTISDKGISVESAKREGPERRMEDEDVSSDKLKETFGFKGVNFGNWMKGEGNTAERQLHLNHAYDSMHDLAELLNVPPKAVSLDGMLGVAIGAQGSGHYAAHFVPGLNEINLTRTSGAGSLAHEWAHALDHYFATQAGLATRSEPFLTEHVGPGRTLSGVRPEIANAFRAIVQAMNRRHETPEQVDARMIASKAATDKRVTGWLSSIKRDFVAAKVDPEKFDAIAADIKNLKLGDGKVAAGKLSLDPKVEELRQLYKDATGKAYSLDDIKGLQANVDHAAYMASEEAAERSRVPQETGTQYAKDAAELDAGKGGKQYWSTNLEKFARAFDAYISDKLEAAARKNTYLSHAGRDNETVPRGAERVAIDKAFDTLVGEIKTKETDKGTALYDKGGDLSFDAAGMHAKDVQRVYDQLTARFKGRPEAVIAPVKDWPFSADSARIEQAITVGGKVRGAYWKGKVYLDPEAIATKDAALFVVKHELAHSGLAAILKPASLKTLMERIYDTNDKVKALADVKMKKLGYDKALAAEEAIADMAGRGEWRAVKGWPALFAQVRQALRNLGFKFAFTDADVAALISKAQKAVEEGKAATPETNPPFGGLKQSLGKSKVVDATGEPLAVRGTGTDMHFAAEGKGEPSYLAIKNPKRVPDQDRANNGDWTAAIARAKAEGRDGLVYRKADGKDAYVAFREDQVRAVPENKAEPAVLPKFSIQTPDGEKKEVGADDLMPAVAGGASEARFDKDGNLAVPVPDLRIDPKKLPDWLKVMPQSVIDATVKAGGAYAFDKPIKERLREQRHEIGLRVLQGAFDQYASILKKLGEIPYKLARLAGGYDAGVEAMLHYGQIYLNSAGVIAIKPGTKGVIEMLTPLRGETERFLYWVAGHRADRLSAEDRERNFGTTDINALKTLNGKVHPNDNFADGRDGSLRKAVYASVLKDWTATNKAMLDIGVKSGELSRELADRLSEQIYVSFFRDTENGDAAVRQGNVSGLVNQYFSKKLTGGEDRLHDLLANSLNNYSHIVQSALKNNAGRVALQAAVDGGYAHRVVDLKADRREAGYVPREMMKNEVFVLEDGKPVHYVVDDPLLFESVASMQTTPYKVPEYLAWFKRALTTGTVLSPVFRVRHTIREQIASLILGHGSYDPIRNWIDGFNYSSRDNPLYGQMLAGGSFFRMGYGKGEDRAAYMKEMLARGVDQASIIDTPAKAKAALQAAWEWWKEVGERSDSITRANRYRQTYAEVVEKAAGRKLGEDEMKKYVADNPDVGDIAHRDASFAGRATLDYGLHGTSPMLNMIAATVPFMRARLNGLFVIGKAAHADPARFAKVVGGITLATMALSLYNRNDKEIQSLEDFDTDSNWVFRIGNKIFRVPKPFELGALATIVDRAVRVALDGFKPTDREHFVARLIPIIGSQLNMNPMANPAEGIPLQLWGNKDWFTGRAIETQREQNIAPTERIGPRTTQAAIGISKGLNVFVPKALEKDALSPEQIDFAINQLFGWVGIHAMLTADLAIRPMVKAPDRPTWKVDNYPIVGDFFHELPSNQSKYTEQFYDHLEQVQQAFGAMRQFQQEGQAQAAVEYMKEHKDRIGLHGLYEQMSRQIGVLSAQERRINFSKTIDADSKRVQLDRLAQQKINLARVAESARDARLNR